jgi:RNA polymerase sigma factor (sigma-70 family)
VHIEPGNSSRRSPTLDIDSLYREARNGDSRTEEELFSVLAVRFRILANHRIWDAHDAEDVAGNALAVIAKEYRTVDITLSFAAWAHKVLENRILSYLKRKAQRPEVADVDPPDRSQPEPLLKVRLQNCLQKVRKANPRYARAVVLHYQGYSTAETSGRLGVTTQNFYMILSRARTMLRRCLETGQIA